VIGHLADEEERVEDERFGEGDRQDRLDENRRRGARVTPDRLGGLHADAADRERRAKGGESDVNIANHIRLIPSNGPAVPVEWAARRRTVDSSLNGCVFLVMLADEQR